VTSFGINTARPSAGTLVGRAGRLSRGAAAGTRRAGTPAGLQPPAGAADDAHRRPFVSRVQSSRRLLFSASLAPASPRGRAVEAVDLLAQAPDEDVDRPVAPRLAPAPQLLQELVARDDAVTIQRKLVEEPELGRGQLAAPAVDVRLHLARVDPQLLDLDRLAAR